MSRPDPVMAGGASIDLATLIAARFLARDLRLFSGRRSSAQNPGARHSVFRGRGLEFEEVRHYQPGDELRAMDWRVTARTGVAHTKVFREERERPLLLLVDLRSSMAFGTRQQFKSVAAAQVTALLAWATLQSGDRVGGLVVGNHGHTEIRPARNRNGVLRILRTVQQQCNALAESGRASRAAQEAPGAGSSLDAMLAELRRVARPGAGIFMLSDFHDFNSDCERQLHLLARHCEVNAIGFYDPMELALPQAGRLAFSNRQSRLELDTADARVRSEYGARQSRRMQALQGAFARQRILLRQFSTADDPAEKISAWFHPAAGVASQQRRAR